MKVFVTGPGGYIGGSVAARLAEARHAVRGPAAAEAVRRFGVVPVLGGLDDGGVLAAEEAKRADAVANAANSDRRGAVEALAEALAGSGKPLLHTSGSSVVGDDARGEPSDAVFDDDTPFEPTPNRAARAAIDRFVAGAADRGVGSEVLCNALIRGRGLGPREDSIQIRALVRQAKMSGVPRHAGRGLNVWSTVRIEDVADLYRLVLESPDARGFMFVEDGGASFRDMAAAVGRRLGLGEPQPWPIEDAIREWGFDRATCALGSNSRVRGRRARALGWAPRHASVLDWIAREMPVPD